MSLFLYNKTCVKRITEQNVRCLFHKKDVTCVQSCYMRKCSSWWYFSNTSLSLPSYIAWNLLFYGEKKVPRDSLVILDKNIVQYLVHVYVRIQQQSTFFNIKIKYFLLLFIFEVWTLHLETKNTQLKKYHT